MTRSETKVEPLRNTGSHHDELMAQIKHWLHSLRQNRFFISLVTLSCCAVILAHYLLFPNYISQSNLIFSPVESAAVINPFSELNIWGDSELDKGITRTLSTLDTNAFRELIESNLKNSPEGQAILKDLEISYTFRQKLTNRFYNFLFPKTPRPPIQVSLAQILPSSYQITRGGYEKILISTSAPTVNGAIFLNNVVASVAITYFSEQNLKPMLASRKYIEDELFEIENRINQSELEVIQLRAKGVKQGKTLAGYTKELSTIQTELQNTRVEYSQRLKLITSFARQMRAQQKAYETITGTSSQDAVNTLAERMKELKTEAEYLKAKIESLESALSAQVENTDTQIDLDTQRIARKLTIEYEMFSDLKKKERQIDVSIISVQNKLRQHEPAGLYSTRPKTKLYVNLFLGALFSILFCLLTLYAKELLFPKVKTERDLETNGFSVLGTIPYLQDDLLGKTKTNRMGSIIPSNIAIQHICARLIHHHSNQTVKKKESDGLVISILSPNEGEGKSFFSKSLSKYIANEGAKTILIDCDIRRLNRPKNNTTEVFGISDYLNKDLQWRDLISYSEDGKYTLLKSGSPVTSDTRMFSGEKFSQLIKELKNEYRFIILDSPPLLAFNDGIWLAELSDIRVLVVSAGHTLLEELKRASARLFGVVTANVYGVLNKDRSDLLWQRPNGLRAKGSAYNIKSARG